MRILVCGDRNWTNQALIDQTLSKLHNHAVVYSGRIECVIEGEARGADRMGRIAAELLGVPVLKFPALWDVYGRAAGPIRNQQMLDEGKPTLVLAFHNNLDSSKGTKDMVRRAKQRGIPVRVISEVQHLG